MSDYTIGMLVWIALLVAAMPYVNRIRHPDQKPVAAYLIFVFMFLIVSAVLYGVLGWLASALGLALLFGEVMGTVTFLALIFIPAFLMARWLARKPPWRSRVPP